MKRVYILACLALLAGCADRVVSLADEDSGSGGHSTDTTDTSTGDTDTPTDTTTDTTTDTATDTDTDSSEPENTIDNVLYDLVGEPYNPDMGEPWGAHEAVPHGLPIGFDWYAGSKPGVWANPDAPYQCPSLGGAAFEDAAESPVTNIRIQVRSAEQWFLQNGEWTLFDSASDNLDGGNVSEDHTVNTPVSHEQVEPPENGGGISFTMEADYAYQWWMPTYPRLVKPADPVDAWFVTVQVRLIANDDDTVDLSQARYLAKCGMNWYQYPEHVDGDVDTIASAAISRFKLITPQWQHFNILLAGSEPPTDAQDYRDLVLGFPSLPGVSY